MDKGGDEQARQTELVSIVSTVVFRLLARSQTIKPIKLGGLIYVFHA